MKTNLSQTNFTVHFKPLKFHHFAACFYFLDVYLVGGSTPNAGNVFAYNPYIGRTGPVCDDSWDLTDVKLLKAKHKMAILLQKFPHYNLWTLVVILQLKANFAFHRKSFIFLFL